MPFVQPYIYVDGTTINSTEQNSNDDDAKVYVNQGITTADLAGNTFDSDSIARGELSPINNDHQFVTGHIYGGFVDREVSNRSYFTSLIKPNDQTQSIQYIDVFETGDRVYLQHAGSVFITFHGAFKSEENITGASHKGPGRGKWHSQVRLKMVDESDNSTEYVQGTRGYSFEETSAASADSFDPGGGGNVSRRVIAWQWMVKDLPSGWYQFSVAINPKVEQGHCNARSFICEVFYS